MLTKGMRVVIIGGGKVGQQGTIYRVDASLLTGIGFYEILLDGATEPVIRLAHQVRAIGEG